MSKWIVTEAYGDADKVVKLIHEAIGIASVTGSKGTTSSETTVEGIIKATATVERAE